MLVGDPSSLRALVPSPGHRTNADVYLRKDYAGLICGPIFDDEGPQYYLAQDGVVLTPSRASGPVVSIKGNTAYWNPTPHGTGPTAVQGFSTIVSEGHVATSADLNTQRVGRSAVGITTDDKIFLASAEGLSMIAFAAALVAMGAKYAAYTDGGSSVQGWLGNVTLGRSGAPPVPSFVGLASGTGLSRAVRRSPWIAASVLGAAGYVAWRAWQRRALAPSRSRTYGKVRP